ncbi:transposase [Rhizobium tibeticum]|nr:transposase [Rhizobium tibeticum]
MKNSQFEHPRRSARGFQRVDREGTVVHEAKTASTPEAIAAALAKAPACRRIVFETGRMAPMLYHGLAAFGLPVACIESRQAHQALKILATHKTDRNGAGGLAHLARTGFFKPVHVKSLPTHAVRALIIARKKLVGQGHAGEPDPWSRRGVRCPPAARPQPGLHRSGAAGQRGDQWPVRSDGRPHHRPDRRALGCRRDRRRHQEMARVSGACRRLMTIPGVGQLTALAFTAAVDDPGRFRRSRDIGAYLGLVPRRYQSGEVDYTGSISKCGDRRMRTLLYEAANVMLTRYKGPLKLKDWALALARRSTM